jgi:hypothetical protein
VEDEMGEAWDMFGGDVKYVEEFGVGPEGTWKTLA